TKTDGQDSIRRTGSANTAAAALNPDSSTNSSRRPKTKPGCCPATVRSNEVTTPIATNTRMCANVNITTSSRETGIVCRRSASARRRNTATPRMVGVSNGLPPITSRTRNHTAMPAAPRRPAMMPSRYTSGGRAVSLSASPGADGGADAPEVLLDVADEDRLHGLLSGHRRYTLEDAATAVELRVPQRANHAGRRGRAFLVQLQVLGLRALGMLARVLRVHLVEHRPHQRVMAAKGSERAAPVTRSLPHVVIVGGGFGGLYGARALAHRPVRVTLLDRRNHHLFQPLLYQVATAALNASDIAVPLR